MSNQPEAESNPKPKRENSCYDTLSASVVGFLPKCFTGFTSCILNPVAVVICILLGLIILVVLCAGVTQGSLETQLHEIWIPEDSRIQGERDFYVEHFGGSSYLEFAIITDKDGVTNTVNTVSKLDALVYVTAGMQNQNEQCEDEIVVNTREPTFQAETSTGTHTFHLSNFCEQVQVPLSLTPCPTCTLSTSDPNRYGYIAKQLPVAWGYAALARCTWANRASSGVVMPSSYTALGIAPQAQQAMSDWSLEPTWGIERFPCKGANILKVFREGDIGYPACLRLLEKDRSNWAGTAAAAFGVFGTADANYHFAAQSNCLDGTPVVGKSVKAQFIEDLQVATGCLTAASTCMSSAVASGTATTWIEMLKAYNNNFYAFGFRHKMSYKTLASGSTDDGAAAIASFLSTSIANHEKSFAECASTNFYWPEGSTTFRGRFPCILSELTLPLPEELMISTDRSTDADGDFTRFAAFRATTTISALDAPNHIERLKTKGVNTTQEREDLLEKWEKKAYEYLNPFWERTDVNFAAGGQYEDSVIDFFLTKQSLVDQLRETGEFENSVLLIVIGFACLLVFAIAWYFSCHSKLKGCSLVTLTGILCVALGVMGGYGFLGWIGWKYSVTSPVVALVGLGLGCDDMFVILNSYFSNVGYGIRTEKAILATLLQSGPSVVVTTLSNIVGFGIGSLMDIPAVRTFCLQMAVTCFLTLVSMILVLMPVLVIHAKLVNDMEDNETSPDAEAPPGVGTQVPMTTTHEEPQIEGVVNVTRNANPGAHADGETEHNLLGFTQKFSTLYYAPALGNIGVKAVVLLVWLACTGLAIWGATEITLGLSIADVSKKGSYQYEFSVQNDAFSGYTASVVSKQKTWSALTQKNSLNQDIALQASPWISSTNNIWSIAWLGNRSTSLLGYSAATGVTTDANSPNSATGENLYVIDSSGYSLFDKWLLAAGTTSTDFLVCHTTETSGVSCQCTDTNYPNRRIIASSHAFTLKGLKDTDAFVDMIDNTREICDNSNGDGNDSYVYGIAYLYWEQYIGIEARLYKLCAICIGGIVVTTMLVEFSFSIAILMTILLISYAVEMIGLITLLDLKLNAFSLVNCVVSIGFAVEYMVHLTHAFMVATGSREERVTKAIASIGAATFAGAVTAFLAILPLKFSSIPLFETYFFETFAIASAIGIFNGLAVWPVILSLVGPDSTTFLVEDEIVETSELTLPTDKLHSEAMEVCDPVKKDEETPALEQKRQPGAQEPVVEQM